jgi:hypothetical protein
MGRRKRRTRTVWQKNVSEDERAALEEDAFKLILEDVRTNRARYLGQSAAAKPRRPPPFHALELPGKRKLPNEKLIKTLAERCAVWLYDPSAIVDRAADQLHVIEETTFSSDAVVLPVDEAVVLKDIRALGNLMRRKDPGLDAWRIYLASLTLLDTLRLSHTKGISKELAGTIQELMKKSYSTLVWGFEEVQEIKAAKKDFVITLITLIEESWRRKKRPHPTKPMKYRAAYQLGMLFETEKPLWIGDRSGMPRDDSLRKRYDKMLNRHKRGVGRKAPVVQRSFLIGDE